MNEAVQIPIPSQSSRTYVKHHTSKGFVFMLRFVPVWRPKNCHVYAFTDGDDEYCNLCVTVLLMP